MSRNNSQWERAVEELLRLILKELRKLNGKKEKR